MNTLQKISTELDSSARESFHSRQKSLERPLLLPDVRQNFAESRELRSAEMHSTTGEMSENFVGFYGCLERTLFEKTFLHFYVVLHYRKFLTKFGTP